MRLSNFTMQVLRNFKGINTQLVIDEGNTISSITEGRNIVASAQVDETFPQRFGIYDLSEFLSVLDLVAEPHVAFNPQFATISDASGRVKIRYFFSDPDHMTYPKKLIQMPEPDVSFTLDQSTLNSIKRASSAFGSETHDTLSITGTSKSVTLSVIDKDNPTANAYEVSVDGMSKSAEYDFKLSISGLRMIPADYKVSISKKLISSFESLTLEKPVTYWVALEKSSRYTDVN